MLISRRGEQQPAVLQPLRVLVLFMFTAVAAAVDAAPDIRNWTTGKGAKVLFVAAPELPMVDIRLVFRAGAARDGVQGGVASLTNALLDQGAGGLDADQIARGLEQYGAELGNGAERDMAWLSLRSLTDPKLLDPSLELFRKVLSKPDFPEADFERERQRTLVGLQYEKQKPDAIVKKAFYRSLYGSHPYASHPSGTQESVQALSVDALRAFYQRYYVAQNATVVIVGDLSEKRARSIAALLADSLASGGNTLAAERVWRRGLAGDPEWIAGRVGLNPGLIRDRSLSIIRGRLKPAFPAGASRRRSGRPLSPGSVSWLVASRRRRTGAGPSRSTRRR